ncbi:MAG: hypothetical protein AB8G16_08780 [Gammaproteobacteria bacterium]
MSEPRTPLREIEATFDVAIIRCGNTSVWPIIRREVHYAITQKAHTAVPAGGKHQRLKRAARALWNIHRWAGRASVLVFSDSRHAKTIDGVQVDYLLYPLFDLLSQETLRYVEKPVPQHTATANSANPNAVSMSTLDVAAVVLAKLAGQPQISGQNILDEINKKYGIRVNAAKLIATYLGYRKVMAFVLRRSRPKAVFLSQYYTLAHMALISAAREAAVPTIELQHGMISADHTAYNLYYDADNPDCYPDQLWMFGDGSRDSLKATGVVSTDRLRVTGNAYIDYLRRQHRAHDAPVNNPLRVAVTLQWPIEDAMLASIFAAAGLCPGVRFVLIPRQPELTKYAQLTLPANVEIEFERSFYEAITDVDVHCTVYSTCALESLALGTPNVVLDLEGLARTHLGSLLSAPASVFANDTEELAQILNRYERPAEAEISTAAERLFATGVRENLRAAIIDLDAGLALRD